MVLAVQGKKRANVEIHLCCCLALWLGVDVAQHGSAHPQPGVHHTPNRRLLPWDAVVVIMVCEILILPPHWLFCPDRSEQQYRCLYLQDTFEEGLKIKVSSYYVDSYYNCYFNKGPILQISLYQCFHTIFL